MTETPEKGPRDSLAWWLRLSVNEPRDATRAEKVATPVTRTQLGFICVSGGLHARGAARIP